MKSHDAASIATLLSSDQDSSIELALVLLEQHPVHQEVLVELLFARLYTLNETLQEALSRVLSRHAPALLAPLNNYKIIVKSFRQLDDNWLAFLYRRLSDEAHFGQVNPLAVLLYQRLGKGLEYLSEKLPASQLAELLAPRWQADRQQLDLSDRSLRQFPQTLVALFPTVRLLDLSQNARLNAFPTSCLKDLKTLEVLNLQSSAWTSDQQQGVLALRAAFPNLQIIE